MTKRKPNRRDFLTGRAAVQVIADLVPEETPVQNASTPGTKAIAARNTGEEADRYLLEVSRRAMACEFHVFLNAGQHAQSTEAALAALDLVDSLEDQLSVYREQSEISSVNRLAAIRPVSVERRLFGLLQQAVEITRSTEGAFDITAGPLSKVWGFHRREGRLPSAPAVREALKRVGSQWLTLDSAASSVCFLQTGMEINLGAIGKGFALDRCAEVLDARGVQDYLIHAGQSSILARGSRSAGKGSGWSVAVRHPLKPTVRLAELRLFDRALGTSGSGNQFFYFQGTRYGHVLDPRTGSSVEGILSATVLAPNAAQADALSTAFFVLGVDQVRQFCQNHPDISAILVCPGHRKGSLVIHVIQLKDDEWRSLGRVAGREWQVASGR